MSPSRLFPRLALLSLGLITVVPFASRFHYVPLPQWWGEINVVWLTVLAAVLLLVGQAGLFERLPRAALWALLAASCWALQPLLVPTLFPGMSWATALAWTSMALLACVTVTLRERFGLRELTTWLAWALLTGALIQSLIGAAQLTGLAEAMGGLLFYDRAHPTTNIFGHIGQRNQFAHYLMWGVVAGCYLHAADRLPARWLWGLMAWLALLLAWAGSRTILLYLLALSVLALVWHWRIGEDASRRLRNVLWGSCALILAAQFLLPWANQLVSLLSHTSVGGASGLERLAANGDGMGSRRFAEMHKAWLVFRAHPLWGVGWSQFAAESVRLQTLPQFAAAGFNSGLFTNAHNLVLQLLAEMGGVVTLLVLGGFAWAVWPYFRQRAELEHVLPLGGLAVTLIHSLLEYPLWYLYFLAVLVMFMALVPGQGVRLARPARLPLWLGVAALGWLSLAALPRYNELLGLYTPQGNAKANEVRVARLAEIVETEPLFAFHALNTLDNYLQPTREQLPEKRRWLARLAAFRPYPDVLLKKAQLEALAGDEAAAEATLGTALASFPTYAPSFLSELGQREPAWEGLRRVAEDARQKLPPQYR
ncbi:PglL family O-oligosaccharyltransferase [Pseudogulbenkiania sp. MAI-1]|uniref:PglL family O-oligosaccharyltransferase n=1 Tax=Pseudogulbenkiania sp. MAI-1 TaxID=990370 RepID=UPI00045E93E6|nr:O-antigen ligase family protein [Pseudogulbenkiania sp. MAI-1]